MCFPRLIFSLAHNSFRYLLALVMILLFLALNFTFRREGFSPGRWPLAFLWALLAPRFQADISCPGSELLPVGTHQKLTSFSFLKAGMTSVSFFPKAPGFLGCALRLAFSLLQSARLRRPQQRPVGFHCPLL